MGCMWMGPLFCAAQKSALDTMVNGEGVTQ